MLKLLWNFEKWSCKLTNTIIINVKLTLIFCWFTKQSDEEVCGIYSILSIEQHLKTTKCNALFNA